MRWLVGVDLRERCRGAVGFAHFVASTTKARGATASLVGLHVLEREVVSQFQSLETIEAMERNASNRMREVVTAYGAADDFESLELALDVDANAALEDAIAASSFDGVIIGRKAKVGEDPIVRLGRVARVMLRNLPCPVVVTPPDLTPSDIGAGPLLLATDCSDSSVHAVGFAQRLAEQLGRELVLVHVVPMPDEWALHYLPTTASVASVQRELQAEGERALERWAGQNGLTGLRGIVLQGAVLPKLVQIAEELDTPLVITGSRRLNVVARFFIASIGSELSAASRCSVAVVPPPG
jgi:nucleotide-binding universal stress UspA family protein